jgi:hypothetical protein
LRLVVDRDTLPTDPWTRSRLEDTHLLRAPASPTLSRWPDRWRAVAVVLGTMSAVLASQPAAALDYDRNDVREREISLMGMKSTADVDARLPGKCSPSSKTMCEFVKQPFALALRGAARRHTRHLYVGTEVLAGLTLPTDLEGAHPLLGIGAMAGAETAGDARRLRGYLELGTQLVWTATRVFDMFNVYGELGARYRVVTYQRPHLQLGLGARALSNFERSGLAVNVSVAWAFD